MGQQTDLPEMRHAVLRSWQGRSGRLHRMRKYLDARARPEVEADDAL